MDRESLALSCGKLDCQKYSFVFVFGIVCIQNLNLGLYLLYLVSRDQYWWERLERENGSGRSGSVEWKTWLFSAALNKLSRSQMQQLFVGQKQYESHDDECEKGSSEQALLRPFIYLWFLHSSQFEKSSLLLRYLISLCISALEILGWQILRICIEETHDGNDVDDL